MTIKQFIEKAIKAGWNPHGKDCRHIWNEKTDSWWYEWDSEDEDGEDVTLSNPCCHESHQYFPLVVLDPRSWQAVGKVEGWTPLRGDNDGSSWLGKMHRMIDAFAEGKSIEEFIKTL